MSTFLLDLRYHTIDPNGTPNVQLSHISSLKIAVGQISTAIAAEFGDPLYHTAHLQRKIHRTGQDITLEELESPQAHIDIEELPQRANEIDGGTEEMVEAA